MTQTQILHRLHRPTQIHALITPSSFPLHPSVLRRGEGSGEQGSVEMGRRKCFLKATDKQNYLLITLRLEKKVRSKGLWVMGSNQTHQCAHSSRMIFEQNNRTQQHKLWHSMYMTSLLHTQTDTKHVYMSTCFALWGKGGGGIISVAGGKTCVCVC